LEISFLRFLQSRKVKITTTTDLDTALMNEFIEFLSEKKEDGTYRWEISTRLQRLGAVRALMDALMRSGAQLPEDHFIRKNPWPDEAASREKTEPIPIPEFVKFINRCAHDVKQTIDEVTRLRRLKDAAARHIKRAPDFFPNNLGEALAWLEWRFDGLLPERKELVSHNKHAFAVVSQFGHALLTRALHPRLMDVVPFFILLATDTHYNAQPLAELNLTDIRRFNVVGEEKIRMNPFKTRAFKRQPRAFPVDDDPTNPGRLVEFLEEWTSGVRKRADLRWRDRLFLVVLRNNIAGDRIRPLMDPETRDIRPLALHQIKYCHKAGFNYIGTRLTRATGVAIARNMGLTPFEILALTGQVSAETLESHYKGAGAIQRDEEAIADVMNSRVAWLGSYGAIDPRKKGRHDSLSATPGWDCLEPFNSPIPSQQPGRRCDALGRCPACPHNVLNTGKPLNYLRVLQMKGKLIEAKVKLGAAVWERQWGDIWHAVVTRALPAFTDPSVIRMAKNLSIGPFPDLV